MIHSISYRTLWVDAAADEILPPLVRRLPGQPKMTKKKEADEVPAHNKRYKMQCTICKRFRHNRRACLVNLENANKTTRQYKVSVSACKRRFNYFMNYVPPM